VGGRRWIVSIVPIGRAGIREAPAHLHCKARSAAQVSATLAQAAPEQPFRNMLTEEQILFSNCINMHFRKITHYFAAFLHNTIQTIGRVGLQPTPPIPSRRSSGALAKHPRSEAGGARSAGAAWRHPYYPWSGRRKETPGDYFSLFSLQQIRPLYRGAAAGRAGIQWGDPFQAQG
jgi:hypothetical protein